MTGRKGNSELFPRDPEVTVEGKQNSLFPAAPVIKCFVIPPNCPELEKDCEEIACFTLGGTQNFRLFQGARPGHDLASISK